MIDNYVNTLETLELYVYSGGNRVSADAKPTVSAEDVDTGDAVTMSAVVVNNHADGYDYYTTNLDPSEVTTTRKVAVTWSYVYNGNSYNRIEVVNIIRPYFEPSEFWGRYPEYDPNTGDEPQAYDSMQNVERLVRKIIERYCNQKFQDYGLKTKKIRGNGTNSLQLPDRIYYLESVKSKSLTLFERDQNGDVIADTATWNEDEPDMIIKDQPESYTITFRDKDPFVETVDRTKALFRSDRLYEVEAKYGWKYLPENIREAALLLGFEQLQPDDRYRQKNVTNLRSADYRMEFGADHHTTTGNVDADTLLSDYIREGVYVF